VVVTGIGLSKVLTFQAVLALDEHQPDLALADIKANYVLLGGVKRDPTIVGGLVAIGMLAVSNSALADGLSQHAWSDGQLAEMDQIFKPLNFLADYQFALRSQVADSTANSDWASKRNPYEIFQRVGDSDSTLWTRFAPPWPHGWWEDNKSQVTDFYFREMSTVDPRAHRAFPEVAHALKQEFEHSQARWDAYAPWNIFFTLAVSPVSNLARNYAIAQARVDQARIAIALERYRLVHGAYPESLDALAPVFLDVVPHDVMSGNPYHYSLQANGTFLLYSVGWDQKDDGGQVVLDKRNGIDFDHGDWVWPGAR
jgi:hypothetical protein